MKKLFIILVAFVAFSCNKKGHTCTCEFQDGTVQEYELKTLDKGEATQWCYETQSEIEVLNCDFK